MEIVLPFFASRDSKALEQHSSLISLTVKSEVAFLSTCTAVLCIVLSQSYSSDKSFSYGWRWLFCGVCVETWRDKCDHVHNYLRQMFGCHWIKQLTSGSGRCHGNLQQPDKTTCSRIKKDWKHGQVPAACLLHLSDGMMWSAASSVQMFGCSHVGICRCKSKTSPVLFRRLGIWHHK